MLTLVPGRQNSQQMVCGGVRWVWDQIPVQGCSRGPAGLPAYAFQTVKLACPFTVTCHHFVLKKGNCHLLYIINKCYPLLPACQGTGLHFRFSVMTSFCSPNNPMR